MKDLNVRQDSTKILKENTDSNLLDLGHNNFLLDTSPEARRTKTKMNYWDFIKIKSFCTGKEIVNKTKRQPSKWEKIFANVLSDKRLVSKIYKDKLNTSKPSNPVKKCPEDRNRHFSKEDIQMANRHMKKCSTSLGIKEIQIKTLMRYHLTLVRMAKFKTQETTGIGKDKEKEELLHCWRECKVVQPLWKTVWRLKLKTELPYNPPVTLLGIYPKDTNSYLKGHIHPNVYSSNVHNNQTMDRAEISIKR